MKYRYTISSIKPQIANATNIGILQFKKIQLMKKKVQKNLKMTLFKISTYFLLNIPFINLSNLPIESIILVDMFFTEKQK